VLAVGVLDVFRKGPQLVVVQTVAVLGVVAAGAACFDTVRQHPRLSERLHRALTPHRHQLLHRAKVTAGITASSREGNRGQLLHRVAGGRRYHGGSARHATGRLRRGTSTPIRTR